MAGTVYIDGRLIGYRYGGIANYARKLAEAAPGLAPDLSFRMLTGRRASRPFDHALTVFTPPHHRLERWSLGMELRWRAPEILHSTDYVQPRLPGVRHIVTIHDLAFLRRPEYLTTAALDYYGQVKSTAREAHHVIAVSEWTKSQIVHHLDVSPDRIAVVPNGVDHARFTPDGVADRAITASLHPDLNRLIESRRPIILAVGTVEPRKRIDLLLDTISHLSREFTHPDVGAPIFLVVGQAGWRSARTIQRLRELQRRGVALWLRSTNDRELAALFRMSTLSVMASEDEGFGLPAMEAMASGTPVLVSNRGALPEIVGDAGIIEESDDAENWARTIACILSDPSKRARMSASGIERASEFSWARTARETIEVYREVLDR